MAEHVRLMALEGSKTLAGTTDSPERLDERAFHDLYDRTAAPLHAYVARTLGRMTDAEDIVQEAYLRLLRTPVPGHDTRALRAYLFRIASRLVIDRWRSDTRETSDVPERQAPAVDPVVRLDVRQALARLTPRERQLIWLAHVEGADHREIATALDLRAGSVRVLLWRTRRKLARWLRRASDSGQDVP
jgi:RNA polymerase sigma-70 factor (ECF subfamily)